MGVKWSYDSPLFLADGETILQNELLNLYYQMGANRSIVLLSKHPDVKQCQRTLETYSKDCEWLERCRAQYAIDSQQIQSALLEKKTAILSEFSDLIYTTLQNVRVEDASLSQVSGAVKALFEAYAMNFDAMPTRRVQTTDLSKLTFEQILEQVNKQSENAEK